MARAASAPQPAAAPPALGRAGGYRARPRRARPRRACALFLGGAHASQQMDARPAPSPRQRTDSPAYERAVRHVTQRRGGAGREPFRALRVRVTFAPAARVLEGDQAFALGFRRPVLPDTQAGALDRPSEPLPYCTPRGVEGTRHGDAPPPLCTSAYGISSLRAGSGGGGRLCV